MSTQLVEVFLGDEIDDVHERRFLHRLRTDLERRGVRARIYANFVAGRDPRQVDFLISTAHRLVHAELKTVDQSVPLVAAVNGPWHQQLPGGELRSLGRSYHRQAHQATFAISDDMHAIANRGEVPAITGKYFRHIDTVVCLTTDIPPGSRLARYKYVDVVGYQSLLDRLQSPGPRPNWTGRHWDAFQLQLGLYPPPPDDPAEAARRADMGVLADYRRRFTATHRAGLHEVVPITVEAAGAVDAIAADPAGVLAEAVAAQRLTVFTGPSGAGKTHVVHHAAIAIADGGGLPVWVRCAEYQPGRFSVALARAVAPFTAEEALPLLQRAGGAGSPAVVILDGLNECPPQSRSELLEQLNVLRLRIPVAAIITTSEPVTVPDEGDVVRLTAQLPDAEARAALLASYGAADLSGAEAFRTPLELSLAAQCAGDLPPDVGRSDVFDAYIRRRCPSETTRAGLRRLAGEMDAQLRRSLTVAEARGVLHRAPGASLDTGVDDVLRSALLSHGQGRVAFVHEQFGRFLAAEQLVLQSADTNTLAVALRDPRRGDLLETAVAVEHDPERRHELLLALADVRLLRAAASGQFGVVTAAHVRADVCAALAEAQLATSDAVLCSKSGTGAPGPDVETDGRWRVQQPRTPTQQALLQTAGACLREGMFIAETAALLQVTDRRCAEAMRQLRAGGHRAAISAIQRATYGFLTYGEERQADILPASVVVMTCDDDRMNRYSQPSSVATAQAMQSATGAAPRWGGLYTTLLLVNPNSPADLALLPKLLLAAWPAGGYYLRLRALQTVRESVRLVDDTTRDRLREVLDGCDTGGDILLNADLAEALAAYGLIEPINTADDIRQEILAVLREPENPDAWDFAKYIIGQMYEDDSVVGPYYEVIDELDDAQALQLHVMAARSKGASFGSASTMREIADRAGSADLQAREVLREAALTLDWDCLMVHEAVTVHLEGLRGWAKLADELPPPLPTGGDLAQRTWRVVDELIFPLLRGAALDPDDAERLWAELLDLCAPAAVDVLAHLRKHQTYEPREEPPLYGRFVTIYRDQVRQLLEWGLVHRDRLVATLRTGSPNRLAVDVVEELAGLGTAHTAGLLRGYLPDPDLGAAAVRAIRAIEENGR